MDKLKRSLDRKGNLTVNTLVYLGVSVSFGVSVRGATSVKKVED